MNRHTEDGMGFSGLVGSSQDDIEIEKLSKRIKELEAQLAKYKDCLILTRVDGVAHVGDTIEQDTAYYFPDNGLCYRLPIKEQT